MLPKLRHCLHLELTTFPAEYVTHEIAHHWFTFLKDQDDDFIFPRLTQLSFREQFAENDNRDETDPLIELLCPSMSYEQKLQELLEAKPSITLFTALLKRVSGRLMKLCCSSRYLILLASQPQPQPILPHLKELKLNIGAGYTDLSSLTRAVAPQLQRLRSWRPDVASHFPSKGPEPELIAQLYELDLDMLPKVDFGATDAHPSASPAALAASIISILRSNPTLELIRLPCEYYVDDVLAILFEAASVQQDARIRRVLMQMLVHPRADADVAVYALAAHAARQYPNCITLAKQLESMDGFDAAEMLLTGLDAAPLLLAVAGPSVELAERWLRLVWKDLSHRRYYGASVVDEIFRLTATREMFDVAMRLMSELGLPISIAFHTPDPLLACIRVHLPDPSEKSRFFRSYCSVDVFLFLFFVFLLKIFVFAFRFFVKNFFGFFFEIKLIFPLILNRHDAYEIQIIPKPRTHLVELGNST
jgi:hypothetical protein